MSIRLYMDVHVRSAVTNGLRSRGVDVLTAQEDNTTLLPDNQLLDRAHETGRVLFSQDRDFLLEAKSRVSQNRDFAGVIYAHQLEATVGQCVKDLEIVAKVADPKDLRNRVLFIPLS